MCVPYRDVSCLYRCRRWRAAYRVCICTVSLVWHSLWWVSRDMRYPSVACVIQSDMCMIQYGYSNDTEHFRRFCIRIHLYLVRYRSLYLERITISPKKAVDTKYFWISPDTKNDTQLMLRDIARIRADTLYRQRSRYVQEKQRCP